MHANIVVGNSEKSLVNGGANEKSGWIKNNSAIYSTT